MALYEVTGPDGTTYQVEGPENAPQAEIIAAVKRQMREDEREEARKRRDEILAGISVKEEQEETDFIDQVEELGKGLIGGAAGIVESAALGAITPLPEEAEQVLRSGIQAVGDFGEEYIYGADEGSEDLVGRKFGEALGSFGGILAATAVNPLLGAGVAVGAGAGEASERARAGDATEGQRAGATALGAVVGASELISPMRFLKFFKQGLGEEASDAILNRVGRVIREGGIEAGQEAAAGIAQNLIEQNIYNPERGTLEGAGEAAAYGGGVGGFVQALVELAAPRARTRGDTPEGEPLGEVDLDEEARVQQEARDRAGVTAAERDDVQAFEQPDLFAADQESRRERGVDEFNTPERMGEFAASQVAEVRSRTDQDPMSPSEQQQTAQDFAEMFEADPSTVSEVTPAPIREDVAGDINVNAVRQEIITTAEEAGIPIRDEKQLNDLVLQEVNFRESELAAPREREAAAQDPKQLDVEDTIAASPIPYTQPQEFQERDGQVLPQTEVPFVPEGRERKPRRSAANLSEVAPEVAAAPEITPEITPAPEVVTEPEPTPEPVPVTKEMLDELGVQSKAPLRKRVIGKDLNSDDVRKQLGAYSRNKNVQDKFPETTKKITNLLEGTSDEQAGTVAPREATQPIEQGLPQGRDDEGPSRASFAPDTRTRVADTDTERTPTLAGSRLAGAGIGTAAPARGTTGRATPLGTTSLTPVEPVTSQIPMADIQPISETPAVAIERPQDVVRAKPALQATLNVPKEFSDEAIRASQETDDPIQFGVQPQVEPEAKPKPEAKAKAKAKAEDTRSETVKKGEAAAAKKKAAPRTISRPKAKKETTSRISSKVKELTNNNPLGRPTSREDTKFGGKVVDLSDSDANKVADLIERGKPGKNNKDFFAYQYFSKHQDPSAAMLHIAADLRASALAQQNTSKEEVDVSGVELDYVVKHFKNTGAIGANKARQWVENNLDAETNTALQEQIDFLRAEEAILIDDVSTYGVGKKAVDRKVAEAEAAQEKVRIAAIANNTSVVLPQPTPVKVFSKKEIEKYIAENDPTPPKVVKKKDTKGEKETVDTSFDDIDATVDAMIDSWKAGKLGLELSSDAVVGLDIPVHPSVRDLINQGDLAGALQALQVTGATGRVRQIAGVLSKVVGDTKVQVRKLVVDESSNIVAGKFDPETNTITLNAETGINVHTILHEMTHAATSQTLANKSHPMTKQLTKLFNDVKDSLGTAYGSQNVDEFVSEAFGNPEFQQILSKINVKGEPISALQRFFNTVANVLRRAMGMKTKPAGSALTAADNLINNVLSPAPQYRDAGALYMMSSSDGVKKLMDTVGNVHKSLGPLTPEFRKGFANQSLEFMYRTSDVVKQLYLGLIGTKSLGDVSLANGLGTLGSDLHVLIEEFRGGVQDSDSEVKAAIDKIIPWARAHPKQQARLDRIIYSQDYGATIYQVNPTIKNGLEFYKGKFDDSGNDLAKIWQAQQEEWKLLDDRGKEVFEEMRRLYTKQYKELEAVIKGEIDDVLAPDPSDDAATAKKKKESIATLKNDVLARLFDKNTLDVYFPLMRQGRYKLTYNLVSSNRDPYVMRMFETKRERDIAEKEARADPDIVKNSVETSDGELASKDFSNAPPTSFVGTTLSVLRANNVDTDVQDQIMRLFIDSLPETSFARSLQGRKGTVGYLDNSLKAMRVKAYDIGRQTQRLKYSSLLRAEEKKITEAKPLDTPERKSLVGRFEKAALPTFVKNQEELIRRARFARLGAENKNTERYYKTANQGAFIYTIGFNASSALVNLTQVPVFAYPYMAAEHGSIEAFKAIKLAGKLAGKAVGTNKNIDSYYDVSKDAEGNKVYTLKKDLNFTKEQRTQLEEAATLIQVAMSRGALAGSHIQEAAGLDESGREATGNPAARLLDKTSTLSAIFFQAGEKFNRQTILLAQYNLILSKMKTAPGKGYYSNTQGKFIDTKAMDKTARERLAATEAMYQTEQTNGGMVLETAPRFSQQGIGRVALMYKSYGLNMYYTMLRSAKTALDSEKDPALRKTAFKQLLGVHGSAALFAGIHGTPIYGIMATIADMFLDDEEEDFDTIVRKAIGEGWYKGPISEYIGMDISDRVKLNGLVLQENRYNTDPSAEELIGGMIGGPALSTGKRLARGIADLGNGELQRGTESILPPALANMYKTLPFLGRYQQDDGIYTRRGDPIYDDMTQGEMLWQFVGFAPTGYTLEQERNQSTKGIDRAVNERRTKLLKQYYVAKRMGDYDKMYEVRDEMFKFGNRHRGARITPESINRSMSQHARTSTKMYNGITISPLMQRELRWMRAGWDD